MPSPAKDQPALGRLTKRNNEKTRKGGLLVSQTMVLHQKLENVQIIDGCFRDSSFEG